jgi:cell division protein ZapA
MNAVASPVSVSILDREYQIACPPDERPGLIAAAAYLDGKMREVRNGARSATADRIAVLAALNVVHELLELKRDSTQADSAVGDDLMSLRSRLDAVVGGLLPR